MDVADFPSLTNFLNNYWNEMGDEVHGTLEGAATAFAHESWELQEGLLDDLDRAATAGLFADSFDDPTYQTIFWSEFGRLISKEDVCKIKSIIGRGNRIRS